MQIDKAKLDEWRAKAERLRNNGSLHFEDWIIPALINEIERLAAELERTQDIAKDWAHDNCVKQAKLERARELYERAMFGDLAPEGQNTLDGYDAAIAAVKVAGDE